MAVKYIIPFRAHDGVEWRTDIATDAYVGSPIFVHGVSEKNLQKAYTPTTTDDPFSPVINSQITLNIINEGQMDLSELQGAQDKDFTAKVYREGILDWSGFLIPDKIQYPLLSAPFNVQLTATDGLSLLDTPYVHTDLPGGRCPINYIRDILFNNLGIVLPIRWTNNLACTAFGAADVMSSSVIWSAYDDGFLAYQSTTMPPQTSLYILTGLLQAFQCRIYQAKGKWVIRRVNDSVTGSVLYKQIEGNTDALSITSGAESLLKQIGRYGYPFAEEDQVMTGIPGIKSCEVTYNANVRANILPNGSQDTLSSAEKPLFWAFTPTTGFTDVTSVPSLDGQKGNATAVLYVPGVGDPADAYFTTIDGKLPLDTFTLIKYVNFGFLFSPTGPGFPNTGGLIDWSSEPFKIQVIFRTNTAVYYLNQYGFWQTAETYISITVPGLSIDDVAQIDFNNFQNIIMPAPVAQPVAGDTLDIQVIFVLQGNQEYKVDNIYLNIATGNDVYYSSLDSSKNTMVDKRQINISSSFGGYMLSNLMSEWSNSGAECFFSDALAYTGTLTGMTANAIMRFRYKASKIFNGSINVRGANWSFDEIHLIDSFGTSRFLPLAGSYNIEKCEVNGLITMECRNDFVTFTEKYYNSNDNQLSN